MRVVSTALLSCPCWSSWAQQRLAELSPLTKGTAEQFVSSTAVSEVAVLIVQYYWQERSYSFS